MMMVIPTQSHVTLYYGRTAANTVGQVLEIIGWMMLLGLSGWRFVLWRRRRRLAGAVRGAGPMAEIDLEEGEDRGETTLEEVDVVDVDRGNGEVDETGFIGSDFGLDDFDDGDRRDT
jgi:hypothetical protein